MNSIPIIIDDVRSNEHIKFARCIYFTIESDIPFPNWILNYGNFSLSFFLLGLKGIISGPFKSSNVDNINVFYNPKDFEDLYNIAESNENFYISHDELWVPTNILKPFLKRGDFYRIDFNFFLTCFKYTQGLITFDNLITSISDQTNEAKYSEVETQSFRIWSQKVVEESFGSQNYDGEYINDE